MQYVSFAGSETIALLHRLASLAHDLRGVEKVQLHLTDPKKGKAPVHTSRLDADWLLTLSEALARQLKEAS